MDILSYVLAKNKSKAYTDDKVSEFVEGLNYQGSVPTVADLPASSTKGYCYNIEDGSGMYVWTGTKWSPASKAGPSGTIVEANVPLVGGEDELVTLKVGDTIYSNLNYHPFPDSFDTTHTLQEFGLSVVNYEAFATGCVWFGGIECSDLPGNMMQCECKVTAIRDTTDFVRNIAIVEIFSSNMAPYYWHYNTDSWNKGTGINDWKYTASIDGSKFDTSGSSSDSYNVKVKRGDWDGWEFFTERDVNELPAYPADTSKKYVLGLKYENNA